MKKSLLLLLLLAPFGCARAQNAAPETPTQVAKPVDEWTQRRALYDYDTTQPLEIKWGKSNDNIAASTTKLTFRGARGGVVPAYYVAPQGATTAQKLPAIVLLHGKDGRIEDVVPLALVLAARGYASILPEVVGHGERRNGVPLFNPDAPTMRAGFIESVQDIRRAVDVLQSRPEIDGKRIGLLGISMGAIMGTLTSAVEERIQTAVLIVGGGDWATIGKQSNERFARDQRKIGALTEEQITLLNDIDPKNFAAHISPRPVLMLNGRRDSIIPAASATILFEAAREPKKQIWFETGHLIPPADAALPTIEWLNEKLKAAPAPAVAASLTQ
ncbi:MAG TPA: alpha/beta fold hydrolase [Abditibacteriaceae bacterium]|jgi:cephalosporin-C deacetylase-like acetyl esterase